MKGFIKCIILYILLISLFACGTEEKTQQEVSGEMKQTELNEDQQQLSDEEAHLIVSKNLDSLQDVMSEIMPNHPDWAGAEWIVEPERDQESFDEAVKITGNAMKDLMTKSRMKEMVQSYLIASFVYLDARDIVTSDKIDVRFQVIDQTEDSFKVQYIELENEAGNTNPGTHTLQYIKEDGKWKFDDKVFIDTNEQPLNLTFEDVKDIYNQGESDSESKLLDQVHMDGEEYLVVQYGDFIQARNVNDSSINLELAEQYKEQLNQNVEEENLDEDKITGVRSDEEVVGHANYITRSLEEKNEWVEITVSYPTFQVELLDKELEAVMKNKFESFKEFTKDVNHPANPSGEKYTYEIYFEEPVVTESYVSIPFYERTYEGGVHGYIMSTPFNYSLESNKVMNIEDVFQRDKSKLNTLSERTYEELMNRENLFYDVLEEATKPNWDNFSTFALTRDSLILKFQPYNIGPYSEGIIEVEFSLDEIKEW